MDISDKIVAEIADRECRRISDDVIRHLQEMKDSLLSGGDSPLKNVWEEICVQIQGHESPMWEMYTDLVETVITGFVQELKAEAKQAIWLQTDEADQWSPENYDGEVSMSEEEIAQYIMNDYVFKAAADWTNERIEKFNERAFD